MTIEKSTRTLEEGSALFAKLATLGLPEAISLEDFECLLQEVETSGETGGVSPNGTVNPLRAILIFIACHLLGRQEADVRRRATLRARELFLSQHKFKSKLPVPSSRPNLSLPELSFVEPMSVARSCQNLAYCGLSAIKLEYESETRRIHELGCQNKALIREIQAKREQLLLLEMLKLREETRLKRLGDGMASYIRSSRKDSSRIMQAVAQLSIPQLPTTSDPPYPPPTLNANFRSFRHNDEAFTKMYRLHIEGSKSRPGGSSPSSALSIQKHLQAITDSFPVTTDQDLDAMSQVLQTQTTLLQGKLDRAAALEWMIESHLQLLTIFRTEVGPNLKLALGEETARVDGYLEAMKRHIKAQTEERLSPGLTTSMTSDLRRALDVVMSGTRTDILDEFDRKIKRVVESKKLVQATSPLIDFLETSAEGSDQIRTKVEGMVDAKRNEALLERKLTKADHGRVITEDVKGMLASIKRLR